MKYPEKKQSALMRITKTIKIKKMNIKRLGLNKQDGFSDPFTIFYALAFVVAITAIVTNPNDKGPREEFKTNVLLPFFNSSKAQGQAAPANPFPTGTANPFIQPQQQPKLPPEPSTYRGEYGNPFAPPSEPTKESVQNSWDACEARWVSRDGGKTKTMVPKSCTKPYHGPTCTHASVH